MNGPSLEFLKNIVVDSKLYFSTAAAFNDPFDCAPALSMAATNAEFAEYLKGVFKCQYPDISGDERRRSVAAIVKDPMRNHRSAAVQKTLKQGFKDIANWVGVLSLSEVPDDILMWSHYADSHRGVCLRFTTNTGFFRDAQQVMYQDERPVVNLIQDTPLDYQKKSVLYKSRHWSYEKEWRIIDHGKPGHGVHEFDPIALDGIVVGAKIEEKSLLQLQQWVLGRTAPLEILKATIDPDRFELRIKSIS